MRKQQASIKMLFATTFLLGQFAVVGCGHTSLPSAGASPVVEASANSLRSVAQSHVDRNVPVDKEFDEVLRRDVTAFLKTNRGVAALISIELLRKGATQSGVAYPKFYLWLTAKKTDGSRIAGAMRVAAVETKGFEVTDFLTAQEILADPGVVETTFPAALTLAIRDKARVASP